MKRVMTMALLLVGCGVDQAATPAASTHSQALTCGTEPTDNGNGTATLLGCPFEQQLHNINAHGTPLTAAQLTAAGSAVDFHPALRCGDWVMGTDSSRATVFVNLNDGSVRSHGAVHSGFPATVLPSMLAAPLELRQ